MINEPQATSVTGPSEDETHEAATDETPARLNEAVQLLQEQLRRADERAAAHERLIERLHDENDKLRAGERQLLLRPVQTDLQRLRNDLLRQATSLPVDFSAEKAAALLESFAFSVEMTLERCGIRVLHPAQGDTFDSASHRATSTVPADSPDLDATIAELVTDGYVDTVAGRVVAPAAVRVRRWSGAPEPVAPAARAAAD